MERLRNAWQAQQTPKESQRRYGDAWQRQRRQTERAIRMAVVAFRFWTQKRGLSRADAARAIGVRERTVGFWEQLWRKERLQRRSRGRKIERSPLHLRSAVIAAYGLMGPKVGVRVLQLFYRGLPRRELEDMARRYKALHARKRRLLLFNLNWKMPGTVWAIDHTIPPTLIDGLYPAVLAVRDLASGNQLAWQGVRNETAQEVALVLEPLLIQYGPPLVLKKDNGSALNEQSLNGMLDRFGVIGLLSPPRTPGYNGSCEAGIGAMKVRSTHQAALHGRPAQWSSDDCEAARMLANTTAACNLPGAPSPQVAWDNRNVISKDFRLHFRRFVDMYRNDELKQLNHVMDANVELPAVQERRAIRRALQACGVLHIERRRFTLPIQLS